MKNRLSIVLIAIVFCSCKSTELVYLSVQEPAPVTLPSYIKTVGVVNRTKPEDNMKAVEVVNKLFSLESVNLDREGALSSMNGLADELDKNNRFTDVKLIDIDLRTPAPGMFPSALSWEQVERICRDNNTEALFALELFDTNSQISYATSPTTVHTPLGDVPAIEHHASMLTTVKTGWRIYDPSSRNILDEHPIVRNITLSGSGINPVAAANAIIGRKDAVKETGRNTGYGYAQRILPYWLRVSRDYYVRGSDNFRIGRRKAQTGNWSEAGRLWKQETRNPDSKVAGRACYNMAIICEINGQLNEAIQWAQKSYEDYNNRLALHYVKILQNRKANNELLEGQQAHN